MAKRYRVRVQHGSYSGEVDVHVGDDAEREEILAKARRQFLGPNGGWLPMAYEGFEIVDEEYVD